MSTWPQYAQTATDATNGSIPGSNPVPAAAHDTSDPFIHPSTLADHAQPGHVPPVAATTIAHSTHTTTTTTTTTATAKGSAATDEQSKLGKSGGSFTVMVAHMSIPPEAGTASGDGPSANTDSTVWEASPRPAAGRAAGGAEKQDPIRLYAVDLQGYGKTQATIVTVAVVCDEAAKDYISSRKGLDQRVVTISVCPKSRAVKQILAVDDPAPSADPIPTLQNFVHSAPRLLFKNVQQLAREFSLDASGMWKPVNGPVKLDIVGYTPCKAMTSALLYLQEGDSRYEFRTFINREFLLDGKKNACKFAGDAVCVKYHQKFGTFTIEHGDVDLVFGHVAGVPRPLFRASHYAFVGVVKRNEEAAFKSAPKNGEEARDHRVIAVSLLHRTEVTFATTKPIAIGTYLVSIPRDGEEARKEPVILTGEVWARISALMVGKNTAPDPEFHAEMARALYDEARTITETNTERGNDADAAADFPPPTTAPVDAKRPAAPHLHDATPLEQARPAQPPAEAGAHQPPTQGLTAAEQRRELRMRLAARATENSRAAKEKLLANDPRKLRLKELPKFGFFYLTTRLEGAPKPSDLDDFYNIRYQQLKGEGATGLPAEEPSKPAANTVIHVVTEDVATKRRACAVYVYTSTSHWELQGTPLHFAEDDDSKDVWEAFYRTQPHTHE